jgi:rhamnogalacturonan endolyase
MLRTTATLKYSLGPKGVVHGDRFHIAKIDPGRPGLQGYGVQQDNPGGLRDYYYDAATGNMIWQHVEAGTADVGRGMVGDIDPRHPGMEVWAFSGLYNAPANRLTQADTSLRPWPQTGLFWDGDITMELLNDGKIEKWNPNAPTGTSSVKWNPNAPTGTSSVPRLVTTGNYGAVDASQNVQAAFHGDILGDWREEAVYTNASFNELIIFTTNQPSSTRLYTLAHNPDFIGAGMSQPPRPNITYAGG